jgi:hypothetical protein
MWNKRSGMVYLYIESLGDYRIWSKMVQPAEVYEYCVIASCCVIFDPFSYDEGTHARGMPLTVSGDLNDSRLKSREP